MHHVIIYTDGSCLGNPGNGGWAAILTLEGSDTRKEISGGFAMTTNNRMEITGVLEALGRLTEPCRVSIYSDSQYVCNAISRGWLKGWVKNNWIKSDKKPVKNTDLWKKLLPFLKTHEVTMHWLRGHAGHPENERCDELARACASQQPAPGSRIQQRLPLGGRCRLWRVRRLFFSFLIRIGAAPRREEPWTRPPRKKPDVRNPSSRCILCPETGRKSYGARKPYFSFFRRSASWKRRRSSSVTANSSP